MKIPPEKELLKLLCMEDKKQEIYLIDKELWIPIEKEPDKEYSCVRQACCIDNLADRLWKLAVEKAEEKNDYEHLNDAMQFAFDAVSGVYTDLAGFWIYDDTPIHRIVAALLALKRSRVKI